MSCEERKRLNEQLLPILRVSLSWVQTQDSPIGNSQAVRLCRRLTTPCLCARRCLLKTKFNERHHLLAPHRRPDAAGIMPQRMAPLTLRRLPKDADPAKIQSKYIDGVLLIEIGKKEVRLLPRVALPG